MMSNATSGMAEPTATAASQAHSGQRNVQFRVSASQQQQLQQHHHHNQQQQHQQQHDMPGHGSANSQSSEPSFPQHRSGATSSLPQSQPHSSQHAHFGSTQQPQQHPQHSQHQQHQQYQQHQQRPPIPPAHQPRLHHSISAGNISMVASASRFAPAHGGAGGGPMATAQPKKKDPYATAWRTYSKIAEELQLLNPDGSLYPISKEAILKYLHHQSKRIKSSNLHWYVNGLKKHQENLGFPWDDVRYDEQVVSLLKELTLHPVMAAENGDDDGNSHAHGSGPQSGRQRQSSAGTTYPQGKNGGAGGHHYSSSSIDTTRIANLFISQQPPLPLAHHSQQQQQQQQRAHSSSYGAGVGLKQQHQNHQLYQQQHQQLYQQSQRIQQPPPPKPYYHSAPIHVPPSQHSRTPSAQEFSYQSGPSPYHSRAHGSANPSGEPIGQRSDPPGAFSNALAKRKRNELEFRRRRVTSSMGLGGEDKEDKEDDDLRDDELRNDDDDLDGRGGHEMDDLDSMEEDPNRYQPLKRRASTGTLLSQARASAVKHVPGPFATDSQRSGIHTAHQRLAYGEGMSGSLVRHLDEQQHLRSPSPDLRDDDLTGPYSRGSRREGHLRARDSPPDSISSASSAGAGQLGQILDAETRRYRHLSGGGGMDRSSSAAAAAATSPTGAAVGATTSAGAGKTTVHFSEVVEWAQRLQAKYGDRCKDHPWGCVEIAGEQHLELTIKMYLDWAGLVASDRLTMDDLPDLPEFRRIQPVVGGTLRRMASTPLTSSLFNATAGSPTGAERNALNVGSSTLSMTRHHGTADDGTLSASGSSRALFGPYQSPSCSPPNHHQHAQLQPQQEKELESEEKSTLTSRMGSPPPLIGSAAQQHRTISSSPQGLLHHRGARKMPSTPILRQQHPCSSGSSGSDRASLTRHLHHHHHHSSGSGALPSSHHRGHPHRGSIISNSTASSPASEVEDMSDDDDLLEGDGKSNSRRVHHTDDEEEEEEEEEEDDEEEEDEDIDVSNYALSPWAAVKITTTTVRSGPGAATTGGGLGLTTPSLLRDPIQEENRGVVTPTMNAAPTMEEMEDGQATAFDKAAIRDGSAMAVDSECVVSKIGEIAEVSENVATRGGQDRNTGGITSSYGVDATAQVLDSMIIGRAETGAMGDGKTQDSAETHAVAAGAIAVAAAAVAEEEEEEEEVGLDLDQGLDQLREQMYDGRAMDVEDSAMIES